MCSCSRTFAARLSAVSSSSTGTVRCTTIAPWSTASSTKWTVHPAALAPYSSAWACASSPGKAGSSDGWMFRIRLGNARTNSAERIRIYPARQTRSTRCWCRRAIISASCSARLRPADGTANAASPISRAAVSPAASAWLDSTTAISAPSRRRSRIALAMATKFEPRPESRIPSRFKRCFPPHCASETARRCHSWPKRHGQEQVWEAGRGEDVLLALLCRHGRLLWPGRLLRRIGRGLRLGPADRLIEHRRVDYLRPPTLGAHEEGGCMNHPQLLAERLIRLHFPGELPGGIGDERQLLTVFLEETPGEGEKVVFAIDAELRREYSPAILFPNRRRNFVLKIAGPDCRVETPDVAAQREVALDQGYVEMRGRGVDDRICARAGRTFQVHELVDRHLGAGRRLDHRGVLERIDLTADGPLGHCRHSNARQGDGYGESYNPSSEAIYIN